MFLCAGAILFPIFVSARVASENTSCVRYLKEAATGLFLYSADYADRLPPAGVWRSASRPYLGSPEPTRCPKVEGRNVYGYAMNRPIGGRPLETITDPQKAILLFESTLPGLDAAGTPDSAPRPGRHGNGFYWAAADGAVRHKSFQR